MKTHVNSPHLKVMMKAVQKAGRKLIRDFGEVENLQVSQKGPGDFVTASDIAAEKIIVEELTGARPDYGLLLEESGEIKGKDEQYRWIVDPLDGTINFLHGFPNFCTTVALEEKKDNGKTEIIAAVTYDPVMKELFWAEKGQGAWLERLDARNSRLRVGGRSKLSETLIGTGSFRRGNDGYKEFINKLAPKVSGIRDLGSAALALAYVAAGRYDGYIQEDLKPWDMAAGILLIREAGGFVSDLKGRGNIFAEKNIVAGNDTLHRRILENLKSA